MTDQSIFYKSLSLPQSHTVEFAQFASTALPAPLRHKRQKRPLGR
ncbi:hypothetical protein LX82_02650 [Celeribacter halophilus]|uniref:Uncharacterized protein n=1 Tax=Celeribacter halophilus TaxID=576117 RepID=A0A1I3UL79_9RHOB|nr:hypothetical protein LX82_02650 [Celeribacter halophilus]SFJ84244.1 hypothetical protein SAMN04488138_1122 [Celeribacter halophilus]